jgi:hypothetical protein
MEKDDKPGIKFIIKTENIKDFPSINDLKEKMFKGEPLSQKEKQALINFDQYRIRELNAQIDDMAFHKRYRELQIMSNLGDYQEFLKEKYFPL